MKRYYLLVLIAVALSACSTIQEFWPFGDEDISTGRTYSIEGQIAISRPVPVANRNSITNTLAFLPVQGAYNGTWLSIDKKAKSLNLMKAEQVVASIHGEGIDKLSTGSYQILHKQRSPLWYAPNGYFEKRGLTIPAEGSKDRFRRGALGDFVLFISKESPIHCGPLWLDDIGGVKVSDSDIARIYYLLDVGSIVEVK